MGYAAPKAPYPAKFRTDLVGTLSERRICQQYHRWVWAYQPSTARLSAGAAADGRQGVRFHAVDAVTAGCSLGMTKLVAEWLSPVSTAKPP
jgi:hypothetical protein